MLDKNYHRLLKRQLEKAELNSTDNPELADLLNSVNDAYNSFDKN